MKIVNKKKFVRTTSILIIVILALIAFTKKTYSKVEINYIEDYIYEGDTLWSIAKEQVSSNTYFNNKEIREVIDELKNLNDLSDSNLSVGDKIKIPIYK